MIESYKYMACSIPGPAGATTAAGVTTPAETVATTSVPAVVTSE